MTTEHEDDAIAAISKSTKVTVALAGGMLFVAVTIAWRLASIVSDFNVRQAVIESQFRAMADDISDINDTLKDGLKNGTSERLNMATRIGALEHEVGGLSRRVTDLENRK